MKGICKRCRKVLAEIQGEQDTVIETLCSDCIGKEEEKTHDNARAKAVGATCHVTVDKRKLEPEYLTYAGRLFDPG